MYKFKNKLSFELCYKEIKRVWKFSPFCNKNLSLKNSRNTTKLEAKMYLLPEKLLKVKCFKSSSVFLRDHAIAGILCCNQIWPPKNKKRDNLTLSILQGCRHNINIVVESHVTDLVTNATNISFLATKNSVFVPIMATTFLDHFLTNHYLLAPFPKWSLWKKVFRSHFGPQVKFSDWSSGLCLHLIKNDNYFSFKIFCTSVKKLKEFLTFDQYPWNSDPFGSWCRTGTFLIWFQALTKKLFPVVYRSWRVHILFFHCQGVSSRANVHYTWMAVEHNKKPIEVIIYF